MMPGSPDIWLLGSSLWSAAAAAEFGLPYAFAHFFSPDPTRAAIEQYHADFKPNPDLKENTRDKPQALAAVGVICAETDAEAQRLFQSVRLLQLRIRRDDRRPVATPAEAIAELPQLRPAHAPRPANSPATSSARPTRSRPLCSTWPRKLNLGELVVNTITHDHAARLRSYSLLAESLRSQCEPIPPPHRLRQVNSIRRAL